MLQEFFNYMRDTYFSFYTQEYSNFTVPEETQMLAVFLVVGICVGFMVAATMTIVIKRVCGKFVKKLIDEGCTSKETAKTLHELGYFENPSIRTRIQSGNTLRLVVRCAEEEEYLASLGIVKEEIFVEEKKKFSLFQKKNAVLPENTTPANKEKQAGFDMQEGEKSAQNPKNLASEAICGGEVVVNAPDMQNANEGQNQGDEQNTQDVTQNAEQNAKQEKKKNKLTYSNFKYDFVHHHFYIPENLRYRAEIRFDRKGTEWWLIPIIFAVSTFFCLLLLANLPHLFALADFILELM